MKLSNRFFTLLFAIIAITATAQTTYNHPGLDLSQADLDRIKTHVLAKESPWIEGWNKMIAERDAQSDFTVSPKSTVGGSDGTRQRASRDATAAYYNILRWYVTGNTANATCAVNILNAWSQSINQVVTGELFMLPIWQFMKTAELVRLYSGWKETDRERFATMAREYFYPACRDFRNNGGTWPGWGGPANYCCLAIGIYLDDEEMVSAAIDNFKTGKGGGCIHNGILPSGQCEEMGRDQPHAEIGLSAYADFCQAAWNQDIDLYGYADNLLLKGYEYYCRFNLDLPVDWQVIDYGGHIFYYPANSSNAPATMPQNRIYGGTGFQMVYHHYTEQKQAEAPYLRAMIRLKPVSVLHGTLFTTSDTTTVYTPLPKPSSPTNMKAESGENRILLDWQPFQPCSVNGYVIQRSTKADGGFTTIATFTENCTSEYVDKDVVAGNTYYYRVAARNQSGLSDYCEVVSATAAPVQQQLPVGWTQTDLGDVTTKGHTEWADAQEGSWVLTGSGIDNWNGKQPIGNFTYTMASGDFDICTRIYDCEQNGSEIKVKVGLAAFATLATNSQSVFMQLCGTGTRGIALCWRAETGGSMQQAVGSDHMWVPFWYRLQREGNKFTGYVSADGDSWNSVGSYTVILPKNAYVGLFVCGGAPHPNGFTARFDHLLLSSGTAAPAAPANLKATAQSSTAVRLTWNRVATASTYHLQRAVKNSDSANPGNAEYHTIASGITALNYTDTNLQPSTRYCYKVAAANAGGEGSFSDAVEVTTADLQLPKSPTGLKAAAKNMRIRLTWTATAEQTEYYNIYRRSAAESSPTFIARADTCWYEDLDVENDSTYYYQVSAVNAMGEGLRSAEVKSTPTLGLKIYLPMDEGEGNILYNHATAQSTLQAATLSDGILWVDGKYDQSVSFTASKQCFAQLKNNITSGVTDFTIACWVRPTSLTQWARVFDLGTGTAEYMFLTIKSNNNRPKFAIKHNGTEESVEGVSSLPANAWTHLCVTLQDSLLVLYVNGKAVAKNAAVGHRPSQLGSTTQNYLGKSQWTADPYLNGTLDEFRFYTQAMTAEQVSELYKSKPIPTAIETAKYEQTLLRQGTTVCYDLCGRRVPKQQLKKGFYIINGHKYLIR